MEAFALKSPTTPDTVHLIRGFPEEEQRLVRDQYPNILLEGSGDAIRVAIDSLRPDLRTPIFEGVPIEQLPAPGMVKTVILNGTASWSRADQFRILMWLKESGGAAEIITTTSHPLMPLVERGEFLETLYYHLNVLYVRL